MKKKNILVVDDSALMRRVMCDIINSDERFEAVDVAKDGVEALSLLTDKKYDAVLLDINMPRLTGIELLEKLQRLRIHANIIMNSTLTKDGAEETIRALELGAIDFITKPDNYIAVKGGDFRRTLLETVAVVTKAGMSAKSTSVGGAVSTRKPGLAEKAAINTVNSIGKRAVNTVAAGQSKRIIALACSTGGPKSLQSVIPKIPAGLNIPMLVVQHMPAGFTKSLADRLNEISQVEVKEAEDGEVLRPGCVYIAKGGSHMKVVKVAGTHKIALTDELPREGVKPCANYMYESLAESGYDDIICVVMTGMGADGTKGITYLDKRKKTFIIAQDEPSSVVYGMPKAIAETGLVDEIVPLDKITETFMKNMGV